ncbi:MAG: SDR family oxidoreductase [Victivallaceae bacterium]
MTKIFLTGITGLVGSSFTVALLRERDDIEITCLVRKTAVKSARQRVEDIIRDQCNFDSCPEVADKALAAIQVIEGDVVDLDANVIADMPEVKGAKVIFHCAADVNLGKDPTGKTFRINYNGTQNVLALAKKLNVEAFHYVSTAYVAGRLNGKAMEDMPVNSGFNNPYEESKFKAETLVRSSGIPFSVYRPSIITGRLSDGKIRKPLAFYRILEFLAKLKKHRCSKLNLDPVSWVDLQVRFDAIPSDHVYFVPIDYVQKSITALFQEKVANKTYHITGDTPVSTKMIDDVICKVLKLKGVLVGPGDEALNIDEKLLARLLGDLLPYFSSDIIFDQTNVRAILGDEALDWGGGDCGLTVMMRAFFRDFFPNVEWVQKLIATD